MMVLLDCASNLAVIGVMCLAFPVRVWGNHYLCIIFHFYRVFVATINRKVYFDFTCILTVMFCVLFRMIPLVVVIYRVLMVCHVDFCMRHGEKIIRDKLFRWKSRYSRFFCIK